MGWNPKKMNLSLSIDISNALDKAIEYLDSSEGEEPSVRIATTKTFALQMRMYRYIQSYKEQMKEREGVDENKYNHLLIKITDNEVIISSVLEQEDLTLVTESGETL
jgi:predicted RND superfamily exporter protein